MRDGWRRVPLGDLCEITKGSSPTLKTPPGRYPLIVTGPSHSTADSFQFEGEAVCVPLVSSTGHGHASLKRVHYARGRFAVANIVAACVPYPTSGVDVQFLFHYLQHLKDDLLVSRMKGTANVSLSISNLAQVPVALPPLDDQRRIVDLIAAVNEATEAAAVEADALALGRRALWRRLGNSRVRVEQIGVVSQGKSLPKSIQGTTTGEISWFKIADMTSPHNLFGYTQAQTRISQEVFEFSSGKMTPAGSVTFPRVGAAVATEKKRILLTDAALDENHIAVTAASEGVEEVLLAAFESISLGDLARSGAVPSLNMGLIRALEISWPKRTTDVGNVNTLLGEFRSAEQAARATADALRTLRLNLLTALLSGEHEIPATYDELLGAA